MLLMNLNAVLESDPHAHPRVRFWVATVVATADSFSLLSARQRLMCTRRNLTAAARRDRRRSPRCPTLACTMATVGRMRPTTLRKTYTST